MADESIESEGPRTEFMRELLDLVSSRVGNGRLPVDHRRRRARRTALAVGRGPLGTKRRDAPAGRGTLLDDRATPTCARRCRSCRARRSWCTTAATSATRPRGVDTSPSTSPHGTFVELPYDKIYSWSGEAEHAALDHVERFVREELGVATASAQRLLMTVLFTDIVESTRAAREAGDEAWRRRLNRFEADAALIVGRRRGTLVKTTGDGILATFDGPGRAVEASIALRDHARSLGLELRAGLHTGEIERRADDISGLAVHLASRVQSVAAPGEIRGFEDRRRSHDRIRHRVRTTRRSKPTSRASTAPSHSSPSAEPEAGSERLIWSAARSGPTQRRSVGAFRVRVC